MIENSSIWVVSDVDGTLMDHSYDLSPAKETIKKLQNLSIPVILCTSKTASEVKVIRKELNLADPYICLLYTSPSPRDPVSSRMPSSA